MKQNFYNRWQFRANREATVVAYSQLAQGSAADCGCGDCLNWIEYRETIFPAEVLAFFEEVGIDVSKELEVSEYEGGAVESNRNKYLGEYVFVGEVISGPDPYIPFIGGGEGVSIQLEEVAPGFKLGLSANNKWTPPLPESFAAQRLVILLFEVDVPRGQVYAEQ